MPDKRQPEDFPPEAFAYSFSLRSPVIPGPVPYGYDPPPQALVRFLEKFRYRPRWTFQLYPDKDLPGFGWTLLINEWVEDTYNPGKWANIKATAKVPEVYNSVMIDEDFWQEWMHGHVIPVLERHDSDEWFVVDGQRPFDPHRKREIG
jgi:hypothetical protein